MKLLYLFALALVLVLTGCSQHYVMKLSNGTQIVTASKPVAKGGSYYFKDASGAEQSISQGRVREIEHGRYVAPLTPGAGTEMTTDALERYRFQAN